MRSPLSRRGFLGVAPTGLAILASPIGPALARNGENEGEPPVHAEFPTQDPARVREVVGQAHTDLEAVRRIVAASPELAKASWDWGFGDWESALGAASHMGRRDIAELLIEHGARPDLFTHAMMGHLDVVRATVEARPGIQRIRGPHGITLLQHARAGKEPAQNVVAYLESVGDADIGQTSLVTGDEEKRRYVGRYVFGPGADDALEVSLNRRGFLAIQRGERFGRTLLRVEDRGFAPGGAPSVRVRFQVEGDRVVALTVHDPVPLVTAARVN